MKKFHLQPRASSFNRFQTSVSGLTFVHTAQDAHFDPYAGPQPRPALSREQMETVPRIDVDVTPPRANAS